MKSIRDYINIVSEKADPSRPASMKTINGQNIYTNDPDPANAVQTGSGGTLRTSDGKAVTSGTPAPAAPAGQAAQPAADPNAPLAVPPGAEADAAPQAAATGLAEPTDADAAAPAAAPAAVPAGINPETGEKYDSVANAPLQLPPGAAPEAGMTVAAGAAPAAPAGQAAQPANRDAMPFGKAFADAKAKGEKEFTWKGKKYAVQMKPAGQAAQPKKQTVGQLPMQQQAALAAGTAPELVTPQGMAFGGGGLEESNTTGYTELQRLVSLINHR
jgi:hypothetical protein